MPELEWIRILPYIFGFMALSIAGWVANSIKGISESVYAIKDSIAELNKNVAVVVVQVNEHDRRITRLEDTK